jgi:hypothetical protein
VTTKFNIGDKVHFLHGQKIVCGEVVAMELVGKAAIAQTHTTSEFIKQAHFTGFGEPREQYQVALLVERKTEWSSRTRATVDLQTRPATHLHASKEELINLL